METWDYAHCLPYFKRMETCLAADRQDPFRGHAGPLVLERGPATNPLFGAFFEAVQQAGYTLTDDVNGFRQEGFAPFDRNVHDGKRLSAARAYLHPVMSRPNLEVKTRAFVTRILFEGNRAVGVEYTHGRGVASRDGRRGHPVRRRDQLAADPAGLRRRQRRRAEAARHRRRRRRPRRGREPPGPPGGLHPVRVHAAGVGRPVHEVAEPAVGRARVAAAPQGPGRDEPLRGRRLRAQQRRRRVSEPDVPLPADRDPLRRLGAGQRSRLPGAHRADVLRYARLGEDHDARPGRAPRAPVQLPLDRAGPPRVGRGDPRRPEDPEPARVRSVQRRRALAGPRASRPTSRSATGSRATARPRCTRRAPARWAPATARSSTPPR